MKTHNKDIHVLMVTLPYQGHINPMLRFAHLLTSKNIHVTISTIENARDHLIDKLNESNNLIDFEFFDDGLSLELDRDKNLDILLEEYLPRDGANNLSKLIHTLVSNGKNFSCIINNCFVPWVANVAIAYNIPCGMLWVQSCATYAIYYYYYQGLFDFPSLSNPKDKVTIPGLLSFNVEDLPTFILPSSPIHFRNVVSSTITNLDKFQWVFGSSFYELEKNLIEPMSQFKPILPIGPLVPPKMLQNSTKIVDYQEASKDEDPCLDWLNKQPISSVLYIALGSISVLSQNETKALAMALEGDANRRFLWVIKKGEEGWGRKEGELPNDFLDKTKERGLVVSWCQQDKVLKHPAIRCFLTHCGWNSTLEAIITGVPIIAYPDWTDQVTNAKLLVDVFKVGVRMKKNSNGELIKEEVEKCILDLTQGPKAATIKKHAIFFKEAAQKAISIGGSSYLNVDNFVCELRGKD